MLTIARIDHLVLTVESIERACAFYEKLGMMRVTFGENRVGVAFGPGGNQRITFHEVGRVIQPRAARATVGSADLCVIATEEMPSICAHLDLTGIPVELGPVERQGALGKMQSIYIRDPDRNLIEIGSYGPHRGCAK